MSQEFREQIIKGFIQDVKQAIVQAERGRLSPYWQTYTRREIAYYRHYGGLSESRLDELERELTAAINTREQISNMALDREQVEQNGGKLLYYYLCDEPATLMQIIRSRNAYTACVYMDEDIPHARRAAYCAKMRDDLERWISALDLPGPIVPQPTPRESTLYPTLEDALRYMLSALQHPDEALV